MNNFKKIASDGILFNNPVFRLILGTCPTLALTTSAFNGIGMGLAVTFVLICSNVIISLLKNVIPKTVRIPCYVLIIATFVTIVKLLLDKFIPTLYTTLGVYLPLIVVNCIILGRAESFASKNTVLSSALDGLFTGLGFAFAITFMGAIRELLSNASIFGFAFWDANVFSIGFFGTSAGAFFTYGVLIALFNFCIKKAQKKKQLKEGK